MDTKTIIVTLVCAVLGSSALTAVTAMKGSKTVSATDERGAAFAFCF